AYPQAKELWDQVKRIKALDEIVQQLEQTSSSRI
ncbi:tRNA-dihydrouridine synthase C, partial [Escherichia coli]|nr:tRNA-dihydrouridine synthase C [Escherichia coli]